MRVYLDPNNAELKAKYDELFAQIAADTNETVVDLPTYFNALENIKTGSQKYKYFRIPLDEPCFTINMSTRAISVPKDFATYGLGVKGDTRAEIVFFESDRFFDQVDLKSTNCWIQWVNTSTQAKGNSQSVYMDATEDKLLFGWVITEAMTSGAGNIEFAVRWFTTDDSGNVSYSVSTQKATCSIKSSLDLDVKDLQPELDIENILINRPKYSGVINSLDGSAAVITTNLTAGEYNLARPEEDTGELWTAYQAAATDLPADLVTVDTSGNKVHDGVYKFEVAAKAPTEGSQLKYQWFDGSKQLNGETKADYIAHKAGNYYVKIGCTEKNGGAGTRYINSNTVTIPAAKDIKFGADYNFPTFAWYYSEAEKASKNITFNCAVVDKETGKLPNGKVTYTFSKRDENGEGGSIIIENGNMATYKFDEAFEGYLSCSAQNRANNTVSDKLTVDNECYIRMYPIQLPQPTLALGGDNTQLIATVESTEPKWAISMKHKSEFKYSWSVSKNNEQQMPGLLTETGNIADLTKLPKPSVAGTKIQYSISCNVKHVVTPPKGSAMTEQASFAALSNTFSVLVDDKGNITQGQA